MQYAVTIYVNVTDETALIERAHQQSNVCYDDIDVPMALRLLLDNNEFLDGAEIEDSNAEMVQR